MRKPLEIGTYEWNRISFKAKSIIRNSLGTKYVADDYLRATIQTKGSDGTVCEYY